MQNNQKKRPRQSPDHINSTTKVTKLLESSVLTDRMSEDNLDSHDDLPELDPSGKLLLLSFQKVLCKELDTRFANFCANEFTPLKDDVSTMKTDVSTLKEEVAIIKNENALLTDELKRSNERINHLERDARALNLIFYNITYTPNVQQSIHDICKSVLKINEPLGISRTIVLKKNAASGILTVLVKFESSGMVYKVLGATKNLKNSGTRIGISRDLSQEERKIKTLLLAIKKQIHEKDNTIKVKVVGKRMFVDNVMFTFNEKNNTFGNSQVNGKEFLMENFSINFDYLVTNNK